MSNQPLSEQFRIVAKQWVDKDNAARLLEETKTTVLAEKKNKLILNNPGMADAHAERIAKANPEWRLFLETMVAARTDASRLKIHLDYIKMRAAEHQSYEASKRAEMRLMGGE